MREERPDDARAHAPVGIVERAAETAVVDVAEDADLRRVGRVVVPILVRVVVAHTDAAELPVGADLRP